jgi:hypothetical protein
MSSGLKDLTKKLVIGGGVALASVGLTTCSDCGSVDPVPPPLQCNEVEQGRWLSVEGSQQGTRLVVTITSTADADAVWKEGTAKVRDLQGVKLVKVEVDAGSYARGLIVQLDLESPATTTGRFTLEGVLADIRNNVECTVVRTFAITRNNDGGSYMTIAQRRPELPLRRHGPAHIEVMARRELEVVLRGHGTAPRTLAWTASGGEIVKRSSEVVRWRLPAVPGFYQVELLVDHGEEGLAFDTLIVEVS